MGILSHILLSDVMCGVAAAIVLVPGVLYLLGPWASRRDKLFAYLDHKSLRLYFRQFFPARHISDENREAEFQAYFNALYGRQHYMFPLVLLTALTLMAAWAGAWTLRAWAGLARADQALSVITASALAGGFTWVVNDAIGRLRRGDLMPSDISNWVFRILVAAPFGLAFAQLVKDDIGAPLAFLLGAFPTGTLFKVARRLAATKLGVSEDPETAQLELEKLQSITKTNAERFYDDGVSTIVQLAYADPIDLAIRTSFGLNYVIDCISQALLWIYFEDKTSLLTIHSIRGAQEAASLLQALDDPAAAHQAQATLGALSTALHLDVDSVKSALEQVAGDPYTEFLCSIWR